MLGVTGAYFLAGGATRSGDALTPSSQPTAGAPTAPSTTPPAATIDKDGLSVKVNPAIVDINTTLGLQGARAAGTGIVLTASGVILTNNHVIAGATKISVVDVGDGRTYSGTVLGYTQSEDIAVVQLSDASGLATANLGNSDEVEVGQAIMALGNAGGVGGTPVAVTGTVTGLDKAITATDESGGAEHLTGLIEIAAEIQPGDSGGPLVNADGEVVGVDTAATTGFRYQASGGRGYAIPINAAMTLANQIIAGHASDTIHIGSTAFLGVQTQAQQGVSGASVAGVVSGSPAAGAGIAVGDVITSLDGSTVDSPTRIGALMVSHHPGDTVSVGWVDRDGTRHEKTVTLVEGPPA